MFRKLFGSFLLLGLAAPLAAQQPEKIDSAMNAKIRAEEASNSKIMWIEHYIADVFGPRPIGSPNHKAAAEWAVKTMTSWGMNAHLEPFTWRGVGWAPGKASGFMISPIKANLKFEANPWTPGIKGGTITGEVVRIVAPVNPTEAELTKYLMDLAPKVRGGIVMLAPPPYVPVNFNPTATRNSDASLLARYQGIPDTTSGRGGRGGRGGGGGGRGGRGGGTPPVPPAEGQLAAAVVTARITALLRDNPPGLRLNVQGGGRIPGEIVAQNGQGQVYDDVTPQVPTVIMRTDDYNRIWRIIGDGTPVKVEFTMQNQFYPEGKVSYVTVGEIPGTDKADEVVMMGGHLDSWTSATGATDNGIGCAIMMEAARILETIGAKPRRTIRVALWSGEEEGDLGSEAYVADHFGNAANPKPDWNKLVAYWNIDEGTGKVRGATILGPPAAATVLAQIFKPMQDLGIFGALPSNGFSSSSDNDSFSGAGLPGIGPVQDGIEYNSTTWHSNLDTYDRIIPEDVETNAIITASLMYHLANRDEMLPRFSATEAAGLGRGGRGGGGGGGRGRASDTLSAATHLYAATKNKIFTSPAPGLLPYVAPAPTPPTAGTVPPAPTTPPAVPTTAVVVTKTTHGVLVVRPNGMFTYTPTKDFVGTDSFTYQTKRGTETKGPAKVTIVVK